MASIERLDDVEVDPSFLLDLAALVGLLGLSTAVVLHSGLSGTPIRTLLSLFVLLFAPGYALVGALFPATGESPTRSDLSRTKGRAGIDTLERVGLAFAASIALLPILGLGISLTPWTVSRIPILVVVDAFTMGLIAVAAYRRWQLPPEERFGIPYRAWLTTARQGLRTDSPLDGALNVVLALSVVLAAGTLAYAVTAPTPGEQFTDFSVLAENENGTLVAGNYPAEFTAGEERTLYAEIQNHEGQSVSYVLLVEVHRVAAGNSTTRVQDAERVARLETHVAENETRQLEHSVAPTMTGEQLRLTYLLYKGEPPENPSMDNAYRTGYLWITVDEDTSG